MTNNRFAESFANANAAFNGLYCKELNQLKGLSKEEINAIVPVCNDFKDYEALINLVEKASKENMAQAQLVSKIKSLGTTAVKIAKKIPKFAALL